MEMELVLQSEVLRLLTILAYFKKGYVGLR